MGIMRMLRRRTGRGERGRIEKKEREEERESVEEE
jgi:hypothetical protein